MLNEAHIEFSQKRRYYTNELKGKSRILVALHGYGQLAQFFNRKFSGLEQSFGLIVPEGPHRFYLEGSSGRVGASWMTKEWREQDIEENTRYLLALIEKVKAENASASIYLLGFSQGGATAARLYQSCPDLFEMLILWASVFPPDVSVQDFDQAANLHFAIGDQDPYFLQAQKEDVLQTCRNLGFQIHEFEGKHDIDPTTLSKILQ
jgi:predicted esterase